MKENLIMLVDSYKLSHYEQYPKDMVEMFDYAEARSNSKYLETVFFGLQYYITEYLAQPITEADIKEAKEFAAHHGVPFNEEGWLHILTKHSGYIPVEIKAAPEGSLIPTKNVLFTIRSTDFKVPWVVGWLETLLMKVWYTSNIATRSYYVKKMLKHQWNKTCDTLDGIDFAFHNFGDRGSSSVEAAGIGGVAHLTQFLGTDNFNTLRYAKKYYNCDVSGFSISAAEHSTVTSWGRNDEHTMMDNMIDNLKDQDIVAIVADSYDYYQTVNYLTSKYIQDKLRQNNIKLIIRPDSGTPESILMDTLNILEKNKVPFTVNRKGFKVLDNYGIIWGDGINLRTMESMLFVLRRRGYAASNISFGSGGWLMQDHDRDTQGWAIKCSSITLKDGTKRDVYKDPVTGSNKKSKKGEITLWYNQASKRYFTDSIYYKENDAPVVEVLRTVYKNGRVANKMNLEEIRKINDK